MKFNLLGGFLWAIGITLLGFFLGNIPVVHSHYELVVLLIVVFSIVPVVLHLVQDMQKKKKK